MCGEPLTAGVYNRSVLKHLRNEGLNAVADAMIAAGLDRRRAVSTCSPAERATSARLGDAAPDEIKKRAFTIISAGASGADLVRAFEQCGYRLAQGDKATKRSLSSLRWDKLFLCYAATTKLPGPAAAHRCVRWRSISAWASSSCQWRRHCDRSPAPVRLVRNASEPTVGRVRRLPARLRSRALCSQQRGRHPPPRYNASISRARAGGSRSSRPRSSSRAGGHG